MGSARLEEKEKVMLDIHPYRFIYFERDEEHVDPDHHEYNCYTRDGKTNLGMVYWSDRWHRYVFEPEALLMFSKECLHDIADFLELLGKNGRKKG